MPRYLSLILIDEQHHPADFNTPETEQAMSALFKEVTEAGVMLETSSLTPQANGARVSWADGRVSVTDGPFAEAEEVIGGYAIMPCRDRAEAVEWTRRFLACHEPRVRIASEVREIAEG